MLKASALAVGIAASSFAGAANAAPVTATFCTNGACVVAPDPTGAIVALALFFAKSIEISCREDRETSCSKEFATAGKNLLKYATFQKNVGRSLERKTESVRDDVRQEHRRLEKKTKKVREAFKIGKKGFLKF